MCNPRGCCIHCGQNLLLLLASSRLGVIALHGMRRACNVGPVPLYCVARLKAGFTEYIDDEQIDTMIFELHTYIDKK